MPRRHSRHHRRRSSGGGRRRHSHSSNDRRRSSGNQEPRYSYRYSTDIGGGGGYDDMIDYEEVLEETEESRRRRSAGSSGPARVSLQRYLTDAQEDTEEHRRRSSGGARPERISLQIPHFPSAPEENTAEEADGGIQLIPTEPLPGHEQPRDGRHSRNQRRYFMWPNGAPPRGSGQSPPAPARAHYSAQEHDNDSYDSASRRSSEHINLNLNVNVTSTPSPDRPPQATTQPSPYIPPPPRPPTSYTASPPPPTELRRDPTVQLVRVRGEGALEQEFLAVNDMDRLRRRRMDAMIPLNQQSQPPSHPTAAPTPQVPPEPCKEPTAVQLLRMMNHLSANSEERAMEQEFQAVADMERLRRRRFEAVNQPPLSNPPAPAPPQPSVPVPANSSSPEHRAMEQELLAMIDIERSRRMQAEAMLSVNNPPLPTNHQQPPEVKAMEQERPAMAETERSRRMQTEAMAPPIYNQPPPYHPPAPPRLSEREERWMAQEQLPRTDRDRSRRTQSDAWTSDYNQSPPYYPPAPTRPTNHYQVPDERWMAQEHLLMSDRERSWRMQATQVYNQPPPSQPPAPPQLPVPANQQALEMEAMERELLAMIEMERLRIRQMEVMMQANNQPPLPPPLPPQPQPPTTNNNNITPEQLLNLAQALNSPKQTVPHTSPPDPPQAHQPNTVTPHSEPGVQEIGIQVSGERRQPYNSAYSSSDTLVSSSSYLTQTPPSPRDSINNNRRPHSVPRERSTFLNRLSDLLHSFQREADIGRMRMEAIVQSGLEQRRDLEMLAVHQQLRRTAHHQPPPTAAPVHTHGEHVELLLAPTLPILIHSSNPFYPDINQNQRAQGREDDPRQQSTRTGPPRPPRRREPRAETRRIVEEDEREEGRTDRGKR